MPLRPYQSQCEDAIVAADAEGCREQLVVLPCGTGKTKIASNLPESIGLQPWETMTFMVSQEELAWQSMVELQESNPDLRVTLEKAEHRGDPDADIVVASVDSLARSQQRLDRFASAPYRIVFVDEAHGVVSPKYMKVLHALRVLKDEDNRDPSRLLVGLTATPRRFDGLALSRVFSRIVFRRSIREMVDAGWNAEPIAYRVNTGLDLDDVSMRQGDFATGELSRKVNTPRINALVVKKYLEYGAGLPAIGFTVDIEHSLDLAATARYHGLQFEAISSDTPKKLRKELIEAHRNLELLGLTSCQALAVGFDSPPATVCLWDRPTCSGLFYTQGVGRIGRPYPAPERAATHTGYFKKHGIIVDFVGASAKHRLYTASTLYGLNPQFDFKGESVIKTLEHLEDLQRENPTLDISAYAGLADVEAAAVSVNLWKPAPIPKLAKTCSKFVWMGAGENTYRLPAPGMAVFINQNHLGEYEVARHMDKAPGPDSQLVFTEPEDAFAYADSLVPDDVITLMLAKSRWRKEPPSEPQCDLLWHKDPIVRRGFTGGQEFYRFATHQFAHGNVAFSKGNVSQRIEIAKRAIRDRKALAGVR